jgi:transposase
VITGTGRRRRFSEDYKAGIVEETLVPGAVVSDVAGLTPQQLFGWRRQARQAASGSDTETPQFVPAVVAAPLLERGVRGGRRKRTRRVDRTSGSIEVEIEGVTVVRIGRGAEAKTVAAVLRILKAGA